MSLKQNFHTELHHKRGGKGLMRVTLPILYVFHCCIYQCAGLFLHLTVIYIYIYKYVYQLTIQEWANGQALQLKKMISHLISLLRKTQNSRFLRCALSNHFVVVFFWQLVYYNIIIFFKYSASASSRFILGPS